MEEFYKKWTQWKEEVYSKSLHRGLKAAGEEYTTPLEVFQHAERYDKIPYPYDYAVKQMMKAGTALVKNIGIQKLNTIFSHPSLAQYAGETVNIRWDRRNVTKLYVCSQAGVQVCVAASSDLMRISPSLSQVALEAHIKVQKRQQRETREILRTFTAPYEERVEKPESTPDVIDGIDLTIKSKQAEKVVAMPQDKEYHAELKRRSDAQKRLRAKRIEAGARLLAMEGTEPNEPARASAKGSLREKLLQMGDDLLRKVEQGR